MRATKNEKATLFGVTTLGWLKKKRERDGGRSVGAGLGAATTVPLGGHITSN